MSLINDMLKDLDSQRVHRNTMSNAALFGVGLSGDINSATQKSLALAIAACLMVLLAVFAWPHLTGVSTPPVAPVTGNQEIAARPAPARETRSTPAPVNAIKPAARIKPSGPRPVAQPATKPPPVVAVPGQGARTNHIVAHQASAEERVARNYRLAASALRAGQSSTAETLLNEGLALDSHHNETRLLLARLYLREQRNIDAESLLSQGLMDDPQDAAFARLYAQLLVAQARFAEALAHMQAALPGAGRDAEYHATLAGLYQRTGQASEAVKHYQLAVQLLPTRGEWWMGLGISLEQSGSTVNAYAAYQRSLQYSLSPVLAQYVQTRIKGLPRHPGVN